MPQAYSLAAPDGPLRADLSLPQGASGLVIFCHGLGSDRHSPRNLAVARILQEAGLATLLIDLEPARPNSTHHTNNNLDGLKERLLAVIDWSSSEPLLSQLPLGLFGCSSGAAIALAAAAARPDKVVTVVSRGGRPDLVWQSLEAVRCPVLLIVGEHDVDVLELNAWAESQLQVPRELVVIPRAGHLFSEPGALQAVADSSRRWLLHQLGAASTADITATTGDLQTTSADCSKST